MGKYINVGIGQSTNKNEELAVKEAIEQALSQLKGKKPTFSIVYTDYKLDQNKLCKNINSYLKKDWTGMSIDRHFNSSSPYNEDITISVLCISSDYMHFSVDYAKNYRKDARKKAKKTIRSAIKHMKSSKNLDSFIAFNKYRNKDYMKLIRDQQFFVMTFLSGTEFKMNEELPGDESDFVEALVEELGVSVPIFGGGAGSDFIDYVKEGKGTNYQFANGKCLQDAGVVVFCVSDLPFEVDVNHGYELTNKFAHVSKVDKTGYKILELNGKKDAVGEYCKLIGIKKTSYLKDPSEFSLSRPFGLVSIDGKTYVRELLPGKNGKEFHLTAKMKQDTIANIMKYQEKKLKMNFSVVLQKAIKEGPVGLTLAVSCSTRRFLAGKKVKDEIALAKKTSNKTPFFGGFVFSEIGSTKTARAMAYGATITTLTIYDKLF